MRQCETTVRIRCSKCLISSNPFGWVKSANVTNRGRDYFLTQDDAQRVIDACPDWEWRLLFALSRYGGLRCPSEHLSLRWNDVDFPRSRMRVRSPKTEHHPGENRERFPYSRNCGPTWTKRMRWRSPERSLSFSGYRSTNANLRTQLERIIRKAGLKPWPKLFHNLRATRQTELEETFPTHVVCEWLGNSPRVARRNYLQVTKDHFARAAKPSGAERGAAETGNSRAEPRKVRLSRPTMIRQGMKKPLLLQGFASNFPTLHQRAQILTVGVTGLEPVTSTMSTWRSNQLIYTPERQTLESPRGVRGHSSVLRELTV